MKAVAGGLLLLVGAAWWASSERLSASLPAPRPAHPADDVPTPQGTDETTAGADRGSDRRAHASEAHVEVGPAQQALRDTVAFGAALSTPAAPAEPSRGGLARREALDPTLATASRSRETASREAEQGPGATTMEQLEAGTSPVEPEDCLRLPPGPPQGE